MHMVSFLLHNDYKLAMHLLFTYVCSTYVCIYLCGWDQNIACNLSSCVRAAAKVCVLLL